MRYFFLFFRSLFSILLTAQEYRPMLQDGARWNEYYSVGNPPCNFTLKIVGDTILNNKTYKKIVEDTYCGFYTPFGAFKFLREDTINKKVYEAFSENSPLALNIQNPTRLKIVPLATSLPNTLARCFQLVRIKSA